MFYCWNVRTMTTGGKVEMVEKEMAQLRMNCLGLSEVRWTGKAHIGTNGGSLIELRQ